MTQPEKFKFAFFLNKKKLAHCEYYKKSKPLTELIKKKKNYLFAKSTRFGKIWWHDFNDENIRSDTSNYKDSNHTKKAFFQAFKCYDNILN